jgi:hypothetical protein
VVEPSEDLVPLGMDGWVGSSGIHPLMSVSDSECKLKMGRWFGCKGWGVFSREKKINVIKSRQLDHCQSYIYRN